jgi:hypothetical protein
MLNNGHLCTELEEELLINSNIDSFQAEENNFPMDEGFGFGCLNQIQKNFLHIHFVTTFFT